MIHPDDTPDFVYTIGHPNPWRICRERVEKRGHGRTRVEADEIGKEERIQAHIKRIALEMKRAKHRKHEADQHDTIRELCRHSDGT